MDYFAVSKETIGFIYKAYNSLKNSPLNAEIRVLIEIRVSQINGCLYCIEVHSADAKKMGVSQQKIDELSRWNTSQIYSEKEKLALQWCEVVTQCDKNIHENTKILVPHFDEREIVDLTTTISLMNALNRIAIFLKDA